MFHTLFNLLRGEAARISPQKGRRCRESDTLLQGETFSPWQSCLRQLKERRAKRAGGERRPPVLLFFRGGVVFASGKKKSLPVRQPAARQRAAPFAIPL